MSLLFSDYKPRKCLKCSNTHFTVSPVYQILDKEDKLSFAGQSITCISCGNSDWIAPTSKQLKE